MTLQVIGTFSYFPNNYNTSNAQQQKDQIEPATNSEEIKKPGRASSQKNAKLARNENIKMVLMKEMFPLSLLPIFQEMLQVL